MMSFHAIGGSSGQMYWYFDQTGKQYIRDQALAKELQNLTGYQFMSMSESMGGGGVRDWAIQDFDIPGFTMELNTDKAAPVPASEYSRIWQKTRLTIWYMILRFQ